MQGKKSSPKKSGNAGYGTSSSSDFGYAKKSSGKPVKSGKK